MNLYFFFHCKKGVWGATSKVHINYDPSKTLILGKNFGSQPWKNLELKNIHQFAGTTKEAAPLTGCFLDFFGPMSICFGGGPIISLKNVPPSTTPPPLLLSWQSRYNAKNAPKISCHMCHMCPMGNDGCIFYKGFFATRFGSDNNLHRGWLIWTFKSFGLATPESPTACLSTSTAWPNFISQLAIFRGKLIVSGRVVLRHTKKYYLEPWSAGKSKVIGSVVVITSSIFIFVSSIFFE